jgi:signal transduction histidine kinase
MKSAQHILLYVSASPQNLLSFQSQFAAQYEVRTATSMQEAMDVVGREAVRVVVAEQKLADGTGVQLLGSLMVNKPDITRVVVVEPGDIGTLTQAVNQAHVNNTLLAPITGDDNRRVLEKAMAAAASKPAAKSAATPAQKSAQDLQEELTKAKIDLGAAIQELKATQYQLIVSEKMAALGQLLANVGHEINTPVSAIKSSAQSMEKLIPAFVKELPTMLLQLKKEDSQLLYEMLLAAANNDTSLSTREERQYRKDFEERFTTLGITEPAELAKSLVEMQMVNGVERYEKLFLLPEASAILTSVKRLAQLKAALVNLNVASEKTTKIILALKSYSYVSKEEKFEAVNLDQNIQSILTIYHNLLKHGIQVIKNYQEVPPIPAIPDQLGQVWANLIHNAIQAMRGLGTLTIDISLQDPYVLVKIMDTGSGIPADIINRIFEPFFTTKEQGEGTGLGLDICRRIVERHRGRISVESKPGNTVFSVYLPLSQN